jgi:hypothetical protein
VGVAFGGAGGATVVAHRLVAPGSSAPDGGSEAVGASAEARG